MPYTQKQRICRVHSPFGDDALLLQRMTVREAMSQPFVCELDLLSEQGDLGFEAIVGKPASVSVRLENGHERWFHGIVSRFEHGPLQQRFVAYRMELRPWLWQ